MEMIIEYVLCYSSAFGLGLISGLGIASLYIRMKA
jgi:hypothetical protein